MHLQDFLSTHSQQLLNLYQKTTGRLLGVMVLVLYLSLTDVMCQISLLSG
uniref:Uncharacterized protein n=1 Tax=Arundo donax TaxID=35708 RepID=A0A0A8YEY5_ARUDO